MQPKNAKILVLHMSLCSPPSLGVWWLRSILQAGQCQFILFHSDKMCSTLFYYRHPSYTKVQSGLHWLNSAADQASTAINDGEHFDFDDTNFAIFDHMTQK